MSLLHQGQINSVGRKAGVSIPQQDGAQVLVVATLQQLGHLRGVWAPGTLKMMQKFKCTQWL